MQPNIAFGSGLLIGWAIMRKGDAHLAAGLWFLAILSFLIGAFA